MWAAVAIVVKLLNDPLISIVWVVLFKTTNTGSSPDEAVGGTSFARESVPPTFNIVPAWAPVVGSIRVAAVMTDRTGESARISVSPISPPAYFGFQSRSWTRPRQG